MKNKFKLPKQVKAKWLKALRSGEYKKGVGKLKAGFVDDADQISYKFCCLGVARDIGLCERKKPSDKRDQCVDEYVSTKFLPLSIQEDLSEKNDGGASIPWSFNKIANWIEKNL